MNVYVAEPEVAGAVVACLRAGPGGAESADREQGGRARPPIPQRGLPVACQSSAVRSSPPLREAFRHKGRHGGTPLPPRRRVVRVCAEVL